MFHVLNRGVRRMRLFRESRDYATFLEIAGRAQQKTPIRCLAYCLMPNHFHMVLWPHEDGDLSRYMFWLLTTHARHWHFGQGTRGTGHVYQDRFKSFPVYADEHFLRLCRYVERNALRAGLVSRAEDWAWSSLSQRLGDRGPLELSDWPVTRPAEWMALVNEDAPHETVEIRKALLGGLPFGPESWRDTIAPQLGLHTATMPVGRPLKR